MCAFDDKNGQYNLGVITLTGHIMKLSRAGWNNVIIFSVIIFILLINVTNKKLFSDNESSTSAEKSILPEHSVILS